MTLWCASTISAPSAVRLPPMWSLVDKVPPVAAFGSLKQAKASGSQPSTRIAPDPTVRLPPTVRSDPPNAAFRAAPGASVRFVVTLTGPASTAQNPVTVRDEYIPAAMDPPEQVVVPVAAAIAAAGGRTKPAAAPARRAVSRRDRLIINSPSS